MRLSCSKRLVDYSLAPLAPNYPRAFWFTFPLHSSLPPSGFISSHFSEPWGADLKKSGLLCFGRSSARKNLAYLPCRLARDGSTFHIISGGGKSKKALRLRKPPKTLCPTPLHQQFHRQLSSNLSRSSNMPYDHCRKAARLFSSHLGVVRPAPVASTRRGFAHKSGGSPPARVMCVAAWPGRNAASGVLRRPLPPQSVRFSSSARRSRRVRVSPSPVRRTSLLPVLATIVLASRPGQIRLAGYRARRWARTRSPSAGSRTRAVSAGRGCLAGSTVSFDPNQPAPPAKEVNQGAFLGGEQSAPNSPSRFGGAGVMSVGRLRAAGCDAQNFAA